MEIDRTLNGQNIAVIGLGLSGVAAAKLALEKGGEVYVNEIRTVEVGDATINPCNTDNSSVNHFPPCRTWLDDLSKPG